MRRIIAELLALLAAFSLAVFSAGMIVAAVGNIFWALFVAAGGLMYYLLRPWARQVLNVQRESIGSNTIAPVIITNGEFFGLNHVPGALLRAMRKASAFSGLGAHSFPGCYARRFSFGPRYGP
jgi:hypothetical protein